MARKRGAGVTTNETQENSSQGGRVLQKERINPSMEGQEKLGFNGQSQTTVQRRILRSHYHALKTSIAEQKEDILKTDSSKFDSIFNKVESLHNLVQKPREQVADAETLFDITATLFATVKRSQNSDGVTPVDFISSLLTNYAGQTHDGEALERNDHILIPWEKLGCLASSAFRDASGACTMLGPMDSEPKQRRAVVQRKHTKPTERTRPEAVKESEEEKSETDTNMTTMFNILRKQKSARLERLVLNRVSFSQTVENIFALSFLVKDGRVEIKLDDKGNHFVEPKNAPTSKEIQTGEVAYSQFVFRFDFRDWKLMMDAVEGGAELMPHRTNSDKVVDSEKAVETPIRKLSRNRGRVLVGTEHADECANDKDGENHERPAQKRRNRCLL
ncbi:non-structural maintenance of chromosomes element 4 homolog A isoform X1 [Cryptomeria japonica]|uniref:non-structural maintenance of chromosomes element 4 homolog A isoform X1 n=1 Tax=Cryptomeria japonica TaxID=3369 RepID=UPI0025AC04A7|nr:non-structural maintenance of chromosomes element 4 homolog A isoform X1 [Cryptomeria japonica]XP_057815926.1 non-structural maintenance of chromosomes element 4 homolog A isoform X1 [Cryptomeria japonica]XP_057815927.1 non-structural maintenance of chromosomes element 4 homolog A isoform X1 [Cryptomeria japonica]XP_057815928.1 non-structural maintenance of chromosomes element 4 homolog A isoform X1 [Cryptomeria japonica]XP_059075932.1 non-structural maintenance of chromosomes element 4 homo